MSPYGLIIGISLVIGIEYFSRQNTIIPKKQENKFIFWGTILAIFGARTYHIFSSLDYYLQHPNQILNLRGGGLGIYGALISGLIYIFIYAKINKINPLNILDTVAPIIPLCQAIGRLGNFVNREIPFWWTESIANLLLFFLIHLSPKNAFAKYLIGYGLIRFFFEFLRFDTWTISSIKIAQLISVAFIFSGLHLLSPKKHQ